MSINVKAVAAILKNKNYCQIYVNSPILKIYGKPIKWINTYNLPNWVNVRILNQFGIQTSPPPLFGFQLSYDPKLH